MTADEAAAQIHTPALVKVLREGLQPIAELSNCTTRVVVDAMCKGMEDKGYKDCLHYRLLRFGALSADALAQVSVPSIKLDAILEQFYLRTMIDFRMRFCFALQYARQHAEQAAQEEAPGRSQFCRALSVQFLTSPTVVARLQEPDESILCPGIYHAVSSALLQMCARKSTPVLKYNGVRFSHGGVASNQKLFFAHSPQGWLRQGAEQDLQHLMNDLQMCLRTSKCHAWYCLDTAAVRRNCLMMLLLQQQGFAVTREDSDVKEDHNMPIFFGCAVDVLAAGAGKAPSVAAVEAVLQDVWTYLHAYLAHALTHRDIEPDLPWLYQNNPYRTPAHGIQFTTPLYRLASGVLQHAAAAYPDAPVRALLPAALVDDFDSFLEPVVAISTAATQAAAGMWNRNHHGIQEQVYCQLYNYEPNLFLQQVAAAHAPSSLAVHIAHRFSSHQPLLPGDDDTTREHNVLGPFLRHLIVIATNRKCMTNMWKTNLRDSVIACLSVKPSLYSDLLEALKRKDAMAHDNAEEEELLKAIIKEVADQKQEAQGTLFSLKKEFWHEANPYDTHLSETQMQMADQEFTRVCGKKGEALVIPCRDPTGQQPVGALRAVVGVLHTEVAVVTALAVLKKAAHALITEVTVRTALDLLYLAVMTQKDLCLSWEGVQRSEQKFAASRRSLEGVAALLPECGRVDWEAHRLPADGGALQPVDISKLLAAPDAAGATPVETLAGLLKLPKAKELCPSIQRLLAAIAAGSAEGAAAVAQCEEAMKGGAGGAKEDTKAKTRKAKGKKSQQAAMKALQSKQVELDFDSEDSDDAVGGEEAAPAATSSHAELDTKWVDEENCCVCNMAVSPHNTSDCGMVALVTRGRGAARCFRPIPGGARRADVERKRQALADEGEIELDDTHVFCPVVDHNAQMESVHTCGHIVHLDCLEAHQKQAMQNSAQHYWVGGRRIDAPFRGKNVLNVDGHEYLCPLCGRVGNAVVPILADTCPPAKTKARAHSFPAVLTTRAEDAEEDVAREDEELEEMFTEIAEDPFSCATSADIPQGKGEEAFLHTIAMFHQQLGTTLYDAEGIREGSAANAWAQQVLNAEIATRLGDAERVVSGKKMIALRTQLKALLAGQDFKKEPGNVEALKVLLHIEDEKGSQGPMYGYPLLSCDLFGIWAQVTLNVTLRSSRVGHAGHRYLTRRCIEAQLTKLVVQLLAAGYDVAGCGLDGIVKANCTSRRGAKKPEKAGEPMDVEAYLHKEMAVFYTWLLVANSVLLAPVGAADGVRVPAVDAAGEKDAAVAAFESVANQLDGLIRLGDAYVTLDGIGAAVAERKGEMGAVDSWMEGVKNKRSLMQPCVESFHVPGLVDLPQEYRSVVAQYYKRVPATKCPSGKEGDPALCLACGTVVCACGACFRKTLDRHSKECGGGVSLYLFVEQSSIVAVDAHRVMPLPSIYLDENGEEDIKLRRGRPLSLSAPRLANATAVAALNSYLFDTAVLERTRRLVKVTDPDTAFAALMQGAAPEDLEE
eukprot:TRINITY_DN6156_c0_g1_i1.p1 TRINITY_DN6156_c0_g1~~TRINITY_DN6156_c0_g1_i1.p1  ORF type:complete len:1709 (+),score=672.74 TRINITY_DN6156_c0_g1_i1:605-5128(+)